MGSGILKTIQRNMESVYRSTNRLAALIGMFADNVTIVYWDEEDEKFQSFVLLLDEIVNEANNELKEHIGHVKHLINPKAEPVED